MKYRKYVLEALSPDEWKTGLELHLLAMTKAADHRDWGPISFAFSIFSKSWARKWLLQKSPLRIYAILEQLEKDGVVLRRERIEPIESLVDRKHHPRYEYSLCTAGKKSKRGIPVFGPTFASA